MQENEFLNSFHVGGYSSVSVQISLRCIHTRLVAC